MEHFEVSVSHFGPIEKGTVSLKPITIFLGKNNTGKSYFAMLIHTFLESMLKFSFSTGGGSLRFMDQMQRDRLFPGWQPRLIRMNWRKRLSPKLRRELEDFLQPEIHKKKSFVLPRSLCRAIFESVQVFFEEEFKGLFIEELERIFGCTLSELCTHGKKALQVSIEVNNWIFEFKCKGKEIKFETNLSKHIPRIRFRLTKESGISFGSRSNAKKKEIEFTVSSGFAKAIKKPKTEKERKHIVGFFIDSLPESAMEYLFEAQHARAYSFYLPAARSGILSAHKTLAAGLLRQLPYVGVRRMEFLPMSGTTTDFLANILQLPRKHGRFFKYAKILEDAVTKGVVDIKETEKFTYPEIFYNVKGLELPLHRSSSMVSEIAPLILYLKYVLMIGSTLIIEEPESHLHPAAQRELARVLCRLANENMRIIMTSHSDYLLHQIQNLVLVSEVPESKRKRFRYNREEQITKNNVGVYLFKRRTELADTVVKTVNICDKSLKDSGFNEVVEELYGESVKIDRTLKHRSQ